MDSKTLLVLKENIEVSYITPQCEEFTIVRDYVDICYDIQEVYQLYKLFEYNNNKLIENIDSDDFIEINALVINMISGGRNLVERLEAVTKTYKNSNYDYTKYKKFAGEEYDNNFPYRFLNQMRNFTQHAHLLVSMDQNGKKCFDCYQILNALHMKKSHEIYKEMQEYLDEVKEKCSDSLRLSFEPIIYGYASSLMTILLSFIMMFQNVFAEYCNKLFDITPVIKDKFQNNIDGRDDLIFYIEDDENVECGDRELTRGIQVHMVDPREPVIDQYSKYYAEIVVAAGVVVSRYDEYKKNTEIKWI